jgi:hypothetical protein
LPGQPPCDRQSTRSASRSWWHCADGFIIDRAKVEADARFDGLFVLRTNTKIAALQVLLPYRNLLAVEDVFKTAKALLATRPIFHKTDAGIRGHVFCTFLALVLRKELIDRARYRAGDRTCTPPSISGRIRNSFAFDPTVRRIVTELALGDSLFAELAALIRLLKHAIDTDRYPLARRESVAEPGTRPAPHRR